MVSSLGLKDRKRQFKNWSIKKGEVANRVEYNGFMSQRGTLTMANGDSVNVPDLTIGYGTIIIGDNEHYVSFRWDSNGDPNLNLSSSDSISLTNVDTYFCIYNNGNGEVEFKNRLGSTKDVLIEVKYRNLKIS